jgi:hypothetical protein
MAKKPKGTRIVPKFYQTEPTAPKKKLADRPGYQESSLGAKAPEMVPAKPAQNSGFAGPQHKAGHKPRGGHMNSFVPPPNLKISGFGHTGSQKLGTFRLSGNSNSHFLGKK